MSDRIRLLMAISDLRGGGAERQFSLVTHRLSRKRFDISLCFWRPTFTFPHPDDLPVYMVPKSRPWHVVRAVRGMRRLIDELRPDLVFSQLHYVNMVTGTALRGCRHRPRWICRLDNDPRWEMKGLFAVWARWALRRADRALGCGEGVSRGMVEYLRLDPRRVTTLLNGVEVERIDACQSEPLPIERPEDTFVVVHAGRFESQKNQRMLIEAFCRLRGRRAELWMLGEGSLQGELRAYARELGIDSQIRWLGFCENPFPYFSAADCFALSSHFEGLPTVIIESSICSTPVLATRCQYGPEELIADGESGLLTPVGDVEAFAVGLERLANDQEACRRMGQRARVLNIGRFDIDQVCRQYEQLFEEVIAG